MSNTYAAQPEPRADGLVMASAHAMCPHDMPHMKRMEWMAVYFRANASRPAEAATKQEAVALTDEQINALHREWIAAGMSGSLAFARMVEHAHGIGAAQPQQPAPEAAK